ncbi:MAG: DUF7594 domain-containing protein [Nocardioides sp.]
MAIAVLSPLVEVVPAAVVALPAEAAAPVGDDSSRPDAVSAMVAARVLDRRVEDLSQRTSAGSVFANPDGTWTSETGVEPFRVEDPDTGEWLPIDLRLVEVDGGFRPKAAVADVVLSDGGDRVFAQLTEEGRDLDWKWTGPLPSPVVDGATATYPNVVSNGDLVVTATATGFSYNIVLRKAPSAPLEVTLPIATHGAVVSETPTGALEVETQGGELLASAPAPLMWDSSVDRAGDPEAARIDTTVATTAAGTPTLTLAPDQGFLTDPDTVYPVTIDPSFTTQPYGDTWVQNADFTSSQSSSEELRVGTYDGGAHKARSFLRFNAARVVGKRVVSAELKLRNFFSNSCASSAIRASRITQDYGMVTWANQPSVDTATEASFSPAFGGGTACANGYAIWNVKNIATQWAGVPESAAPKPDYGIRLKALDETSNSSWRRYRSIDYQYESLQPTLTVTYANYPTSSKPTVTTVPGSSSGYATSTTPTFAATLTDADGGSLRAFFDVYQGSTLKWHSGWSNTVSSGGKATMAMPAGILASGGTYTVKVRAKDLTGSGVYSSATTFTVDTAKPAVSVAASGFTNGQWKLEPPALNTFTFTGPPDTASFSVIQDSGTPITVAAGSNGVATLAWNEEAGWHTLEVAARDKAGNTGAPASFGFGVDVPTFLTPVEGTGSATGVFSLQPQGKAGATSATVKWRRNDTATWNTATGIKKADGSLWSGTTTDSGAFSTPGLLSWNATEEIDPATGQMLAGPLLIDLQTCFALPALPDPHCSTPLLVQLDDGFGENYPTTALGPASVSLITGQMNLDSTDAATGAAALGRVWSTANARNNTDGPFGRGWDTTALTPGETAADIVDNRAKDGSFVVSYATGGDEKFTQKGTTNIYVPVDATNTTTTLVLTTGGVSTLTLTQGTDTTTPVVTTWTYNTVEAEWYPTAADGGGAAPDGAVATAAGKVTWISQVPSDSTATCTTATQAPGCRGLEVTYDASGHVTTVTEKTSATSTVVATYSYASGLLSQACGLDPDGSGPNQRQCVAYTYDTSGAAPRLATVSPPGQTPWRYSYDSSNRVTGVKRAQTVGGGDAVWAIDYSMSLTAPGAPDMSAAAAAQWGQAVVPAAVAAVYVPQADGGASMSDPTKARLFYTRQDGEVTNTAAHGPAGWMVETTWVDEHGNVVRALDGAGWAEVNAASPADRAGLADFYSSYTVF